MGWERRGSRVLILACVLIVRASCTGRAARRAHLVSMRVGDSRVTSLPSTATLAAGPTKQLLVCHGPRSAAMAPAAQGRMLLALGRALQLPCPAQQQHAWHQARAVATGAAAAAQGAGAGRSRPLLLTLERSVGGSLGSDSELRSTGAFGAEVFPDLPIATTWGNLWKVLRRWVWPGCALEHTPHLCVCVAQIRRICDATAMRQPPCFGRAIRSSCCQAHPFITSQQPKQQCEHRCTSLECCHRIPTAW